MPSVTFRLFEAPSRVTVTVTVSDGLCPATREVRKSEAKRS